MLGPVEVKVSLHIRGPPQPHEGRKEKPSGFAHAGSTAHSSFPGASSGLPIEEDEVGGWDQAPDKEPPALLLPLPLQGSLLLS